jgi:hypothetical protein
VITPTSPAPVSSVLVWPGKLPKLPELANPNLAAPEESVLEFMVHPNFAGQAAPFSQRRLETVKKFVS